MTRARSLFDVIILATVFALPPSASWAEKALFAGGCFWCVESDFEQVPGVIEARSGFAGGELKNPTYKNYGNHREVVEIEFNPNKISYEELVDKFLRSIDVNDDGGQFCDRGPSYTTAIFALTPAQEETASNVKARLEALGVLPKPIVTPILGASEFYPADAYHQDYYKSKRIVVTRFGPLSKAKAYKRYREACGRDARVKALWGEHAFPS